MFCVLSNLGPCVCVYERVCSRLSVYVCSVLCVCVCVCVYANSAAIDRGFSLEVFKMCSFEMFLHIMASLAVTFTRDFILSLTISLFLPLSNCWWSQGSWSRCRTLPCTEAGSCRLFPGEPGGRTPACQHAGYRWTSSVVVWTPSANTIDQILQNNKLKLLDNLSLTFALVHKHVFFACCNISYTTVQKFGVSKVF